MPNFWKGFTESFDLRPAANIIANEISSKKKSQELLNREKELQDYRQNLKDIEDQKQQQLLYGLISGNGTTSEQQAQNLVGLNPNSRAIYENYLKQQVKPKPVKIYDTYYPTDKFGNIDYQNPLPKPKVYKEFKTTPEGMYGITNEGETNLIPNTKQFYIPKVTARIQGEDSNGNKAETVVYDNGKRQTFYSGLKGGKVKSADDFNKMVKTFNSNFTNISKQQENYYKNLGNNDVLDNFTRQSINDQIYLNEQNLYNNMPDEAKKRVDGFYQEAKKKGINLDDYQKARQDYKDFINKKFLDEPLGADPNTKAAEINALQLWGQYKFGYLKNPNGETDNNVPQKQSQIPTGAINYLKQHPDTKNKFEELFGKGSADKYLK